MTIKEIFEADWKGGYAMSMKELFEAVDKKAEKMDKIRQYLGPEETLAQLAEECAELGQAALKLRRVLDGHNATPVSLLEAEMNLQEEMADVLVCMRMAGMDTSEIAETVYKKIPRWCGRLGLE